MGKSIFLNLKTLICNSGFNWLLIKVINSSIYYIIQNFTNILYPNK